MMNKPMFERSCPRMSGEKPMMGKGMMDDRYDGKPMNR
jgi:hypothetical protein